MGTDPLGVETVLRPGLEEEAEEAAGHGQEAETPGSGAAAEAPTVSCPGPGWEEGTHTMAEEGGGRRRGADRPAKEREVPLPSAKEEGKANFPVSIEDPGQGLLEDAPMRRAWRREAEGTVNEEEETKGEEAALALEPCCIQVRERLQEVECPTCLEPCDQEAEEAEGEEKETEIEEEKKVQMVVEEGTAVALQPCCIQVEEPLQEVECPMCLEPCDQEAEEEEKVQMLMEEGGAVASEPPEEPECPICTEPYDREAHRPAPLNCGHVLCGRCLRAILEAGSEADIGRVRCPICRQKTPMVEWEICRLQEELLLLGAWETPGSPGPASPLARRPGFWGGLEHRFRVRLLTSRAVGCLPCLRYPAGLGPGLERLEGRCRWGFRLALLALAAADALSTLLVFLPVALLLLLFLIMDQ